MPITLEDLTAREDVAEQLGSACEFEPAGGAAEPSLCKVDGEADLTVIGHDGGGGQYAVGLSSPRVCYFSSEGQAGVIAENLDAFVALIVHCPYWRDLVKFSKHGSLDEMRRAHPVLEDYAMDEEDDAFAAREFLVGELGVGEPDDLVGALHQAVSSTPRIVDPNGQPAEPLFGRFTIDDNPMLRRKV